MTFGDSDGVWFAFHYDWSGFSVFASEILALRYAVENGMHVGFAKWGDELGGNRVPSSCVAEG